MYLSLPQSSWCFGASKAGCSASGSVGFQLSVCAQWELVWPCRSFSIFAKVRWKDYPEQLKQTRQPNPDCIAFSDVTPVQDIDAPRHESRRPNAEPWSCGPSIFSIANADRPDC